ncbi:zf-TFIIB domain-containing protein [Candidatus Woesearchaeota archaeon]|nr:zf-TFIIB domain-containing protein [Candidatus Woesearchaeota archaeon]
MFFKNKIKKVHNEDLLTCPRCNVKMEKLKKNDVIIDICKKCNGMWLDDGEIQKLAEMSKGEKNGKE